MVERAGAPPETRSVFPGLFELVNRNKKSITLNMKSVEGKRVAERLVRVSDVLIEEFRPGVAERLGVGYDRVKEINPSIIYCSISGFGQDGPYRDRVGHDINYLSLSGILSIPGQPDTPPSRPGVPMVDLASGMFGAIAIMAALKRREAEGRGEFIDVSMLDSMISWMSVRAGRLLVYQERPQNEHLSALNNIYETRDGKKLSLGIIEGHFWENFCKALDRMDLLNDPRFSSSSKRRENMGELALVMKDIISGRTLEEWVELLDWRKIPYAPVYTIGEALADPHVESRNILEEVEFMGNRISEVAFPVKFRGIKPKVRMPPPKWGEHTGEILRDLGYSEGEVQGMKEKNVI